MLCYARRSRADCVFAIGALDGLGWRKLSSLLLLYLNWRIKLAFFLVIFSFLLSFRQFFLLNIYSHPSVWAGMDFHVEGGALLCMEIAWHLEINGSWKLCCLIHLSLWTAATFPRWLRSAVTGPPCRHKWFYCLTRKPLRGIIVSNVIGDALCARCHIHLMARRQ